MAFAFLPSIWLVSGVIALYILSVVVYRRYFHPLSHVPGPFLWSVSSLPILYHQGIREGQLMHELPKLHAVYGPVVRISPNEVHLSDPENYDIIHNVGTKFYKDPAYYTSMDGPVNAPVILTVISNEVHRVRRSALNPFFSRRSTLELEPVVRDKARKLLDLMEATFSRPGDGVFNAHHAVRALSVDIITEYAYARCWNQMDMEDWGADYQDAIRAVQDLFPWMVAFPILSTLFGAVPDWINVMIFPPYKKWLMTFTVIRAAVAEVQKEISMGTKPPRRTIFHELIDPPSSESDDEGDGKKERPKLSDNIIFADAVNVTGAGAETTGSTIGRAIFEVISNPEIYSTLTRELEEALPDPDPNTFSLVALEKLPYLNGVIKEALRLNPGLPGHLPRVVPPGGAGATFNGCTLPPGASVSMSAWTLHHNKDAFPHPERFDPTRWIDALSEVHRARDRCMIPFGRGSRNCLGQNLALAELYYSVAAIFRKFGATVDNCLRIHPDFARSDLDIVELLLGYHPRKARKLRVVLSRKERRGGIEPNHEIVRGDISN
ncbi:cytochrome P450 [Podospora didyma]|uniref:Cytochrome P450 n=1 Tax=Podospora didyma TaxID=330526 RepID=A0AAE0U0K0_9PEZI|nr:cytochrome P450 [Podospora didyma]